MKVVFNQKSCWLRRAVVSAHVAKHRLETNKVQTNMANHPGIDLDTFHKEFNKYEKRHKLLIAKLSLYEATKRHNQPK